MGFRSILRKYAEFTFFMAALLPAAYVYFLPIKQTLFFGLIFFILIYLLLVCPVIKNLNSLLFSIFFFLAFIFIFFEIGAYRVDSFLFVVNESAAFISMSVVFFCGVLLSGGRVVSSVSILRCIIIGHVIYCFLKVLIVFFICYGELEIYDFLNFNDVFLRSPITVQPLFDNFYRVMYVNDFLTPFIFLIMASLPAGYFFKNRLQLILSIAFMLLSLVFSYSRFLYLMLCFSVVFSCIFKESNKKYFIYTLGFFSTLFFLSPELLVILKERFFSNASYQSDLIRVFQYDVLMKMWSEHPFIGSGLGSYASNLVRSAANPYSYELQWISFLAKTGFVGVGCILLMMTFIFFGLLNKFSYIDARNLKIKNVLLWFLMLIMFFISGFMNPYLISTPSALICLIFYFVGSDPIISKIVFFDKYDLSFTRK